MANVIVNQSQPRNLYVSPTPTEPVQSSGSVGEHEAKVNPHPQYQAQEQAFITPQFTWIFNHNRGYYPFVQVLNLARQPVGADVQHVSVNQVQVSFNSAVAGYILYS